MFFVTFLFSFLCSSVAWLLNLELILHSWLLKLELILHFLVLKIDETSSATIDQKRELNWDASFTDLGPISGPKNHNNGSDKRSQEALKHEAKKLVKKERGGKPGPCVPGGPAGLQFLMSLCFFFFKDWKEASRLQSVGGLRV